MRITVDRGAALIRQQGRTTGSTLRQPQLSENRFRSYPNEVVDQLRKAAFTGPLVLDPDM